MLLYIYKKRAIQVRQLGRVGTDPHILQWSSELHIAGIRYDEKVYAPVAILTQEAYCRRLNTALIDDGTPMNLTIHFTLTLSPDLTNPPKMAIRFEGRLLESLQRLCDQTIILTADVNFKTLERIGGPRQLPAHGQPNFPYRVVNAGPGRGLIFNHQLRPRIQNVARVFDKRFKTKEMNIQPSVAAAEENQEGTDPFIEDTNLEIPPDFADYWTEVLTAERELFAVNLELKLFFPVDNDILTQNENANADELERLNQQIRELELENDDDVIIVASNGAEIAARKGSLVVNSSVLAAMLEGDSFQEARTNRIEMADTSELCIKAFLDFLYNLKITDGRNKPQVAVELMQMAHKYDVLKLEGLLGDILLQRPLHWFDAETAFKLFLFVRNLEKYSQLRNTAVQVLKRNLECKGFQEVFKGVNETAVSELLAAISGLAETV